MPHQIDRRQKPVWKQGRRPPPPPTKAHPMKKDGKANDRKDKGWKKGLSGLEFR